MFSSLRRPLSGRSTGVFNCGTDITCYENCGGPRSTDSYACTLQDVLNDAEVNDHTVYLPFDLFQIVDSLHREISRRPRTSRHRVPRRGVALSISLHRYRVT